VSAFRRLPTPGRLYARWSVRAASALPPAGQRPAPGRAHFTAHDQCAASCSSGGATAGSCWRTTFRSDALRVSAEGAELRAGDDRSKAVRTVGDSADRLQSQRGDDSGVDGPDPAPEEPWVVRRDQSPG